MIPDNGGGPFNTETYWAMLFAIWGQAIAYLQTIKGKPLDAACWYCFGIELFSAAFVGWFVCTLILAWQPGIDEKLMYAIAGCSGHFGTRTLFVARSMFLRSLRGEDK